MGHVVFCACHEICLLQQVFLYVLIEHPCTQIPLDYTEGYAPELAQCDVRFSL